MSNQNNSKIKFHIDGAYAYIIWEFLLKIGIMLNWDKLFQYILRFLSEKKGDSSLFIDKSISSVFMGDAAWSDEHRKKFRHELLKVGIDSKLRPLKMVDNQRSDGSKGYKEDGIDALNIAHIFFDAFVGAGSNTVPTVQYSYLVLLAGDSDFGSTFDLLHAIGIKIVVVYFDVDKVHRPTSDLLIKSADYAISLESLLYDRADSLAQSIFEPVHSACPRVSFTKSAEMTNLQLRDSEISTGIVKFIDGRTEEWGVICGPDGDYHFYLSDVKPGDSLVNGSKVRFKVLKHPLPNDGSVSRGATNGRATDIVVVSAEVVQPQISSASSVSEKELKEIVSSCRTLANGFALLSEVGAIYAIKFGKPDRPLKEIFGDYPATFDFTYTPAAGVRINPQHNSFPTL